MFHFATATYMGLTNELPQYMTLLHTKISHVAGDQPPILCTLSWGGTSACKWYQ